MTRSSPDSAAFAFEQLEPQPPRSSAPRPVVDAGTALADAHAQAEQIRAEARHSGREEGFRAGMEEALESMRPAAAALVEAANALREQSAASAEALERHAVDLALAIAEKMVQAALDVKPERVVDVVRGAMRLLVEREDVAVYVNPVDVDVVRDAIERYAQDSPGGPRVEVLEERRVARGGAVLRTSVGEVDARLETKLEQARTALVAELEA